MTSDNDLFSELYETLIFFFGGGEFQNFRGLYNRYDGMERYALLYVALLRSLLSSVLVTIVEVV